MLKLNNEIIHLNLTFINYLKEPICEHKTIKSLYRSLSVEDRKPADLSAIGKIVHIKVEESDDWLIFRVDWSDRDSIKKDYEIVRLRISSLELRKLIIGQRLLNTSFLCR